MQNTNMPIITISRQYGSGGRFIGKRLSEKLGIPFYDQALLNLAAKQSGLASELFEHAEKAASGLNFLLSMSTHVPGLAGPPLNDQVFMIQSDVIRHLAEQGPCVLVGRCAGDVLRDRTDCLNVYVHASLPDRIDRAVKHYGVPREQAKIILRKMDKNRAAYYEYYTNRRWGQAENYHLSLNSDSLGIDACVETIALVAHSFLKKTAHERAKRDFSV